MELRYKYIIEYRSPLGALGRRVIVPHSRESQEDTLTHATELASYLKDKGFRIENQTKEKVNV